MTGIRGDILTSIARDIQWAMDALHAEEPWQAERILARAWETYVAYREGEEKELARRDSRV